MSKLIISQFTRSTPAPDYDTIPPGFRRCCACKEVKALSEFGLKNRVERRTKCKVCRHPDERRYNAKRRESDREAYNANARQRQAEYRQRQRDYVASLEQQLEQMRRTG